MSIHHLQKLWLLQKQLICPISRFDIFDLTSLYMSPLNYKVIESLGFLF